ncbi:hypothetical protein [Treponema sp. R80B11-R83G3]
MNKAERRINDFSSGVKKLNTNSVNYIHKLTQVLFMVEHQPVYPISGKKSSELEKKTIFMRRDK